MNRVAAWVYLAYSLTSSCTAQNTTQATCQNLDSILRFNGTATRELSALKLTGTKPFGNIPWDAKFAVEKDSSKSWKLTLGVQKEDYLSPSADGTQKVLYRQTILLDTADSNVTDMGTCHHTLQSSRTPDGFLWTKAVLEKSLDDNGNCLTVLGPECVDALKTWYSEQAANWPVRTGSCARINNSIPSVCSGVGQPTTRQMYLSDGLSQLNSINSTNNTVTPQSDPSLQCNGTNIISAHDLIAATRMEFPEAFRFPLIDIITFWPNRSTGLSSAASSWFEDVHVEVICMRPDQLVEGTQAPESGKDLLNKQGARFPKANDAAMLKYGMLGWMTATTMIMAVL